MGKYIVQVLNDKEFDALPYSKVRESLGCADPEKGLAFVRETGVAAIDIGTLTHEVNHLMEKHHGESPDLDGIYYKSGSNFFSQVFGGGGLGGILGDVAAVALAPFTGGASLGFMPLLSAAGGAIQGGIQGGAGGILGGALKGFGVGGIGSALGGAAAGGLGLLGGAAAGESGLAGAATGLGEGANTFISGIPGFGSGGVLSGATGLGGASFGTPAAGAGTSALFSNVGAPGAAAANAGAAGAGTTFAPAGGGSGLLGTTNAFNAANAVDIASAPIAAAPGGVGGVGTGVTGSSPFNLNSSPFAPQSSGGLLGGAPTQAGLPSTTADPALTGLPSTIAQQTPQVAPGITTAASSPTASTAASGFKLNPLTLGAGLLGASALVPSPQFQMPPEIGQLEQQIASGQAGGPLGQAAQNELQSIISSPPSSLNPPLQANDPYFASTFSQMDIANNQAIDQLKASYQQSGQLGSGEYQQQLANLLQQQSDAKNQIVAQENQTRYLAGQQEQMSAIGQALGIDQANTQELLGLTGLDVQAAAIKYGVAASDVTALRNALGTVGGQALTQGLGLNNNQGITVKLGG